MKRLEKIAGFLFMLSLILKFFNFFGGGILCILSLTTIACLNYPLGFAFFNNVSFKKITRKESYIGINTMRILGAIAAGIILSTVCTGILFKLLRWPNFQLYLTSGLLLLIIVTIVVVLKYLKTKDIYYGQILKRIIVIGGLGTILLFTSNLTLVKIQYRNHPNYIKAVREYMKNPDNEELQKKVDIEFHRATMSKEDFDHYQKFLENKKNKKIR